MTLTDKVCYSQLVAFMLYSGKRLEEAIRSMSFSSPNFRHEGMAGFIETEVTFEIKDLKLFSELWESAYVYPSDRQKFYFDLIKGNRFSPT